MVPHGLHLREPGQLRPHLIEHENVVRAGHGPASDAQAFVLTQRRSCCLHGPERVDRLGRGQKPGSRMVPDEQGQAIRCDGELERRDGPTDHPDTYGARSRFDGRGSGCGSKSFRGRT